MKKLSYMLEAAALWIALVIFRVAGADLSSEIGGWIGRTVGPRLAATRKARANLQKSFPEKSEADYDIILRDMWDNLGRVISEYPHLMKIIHERMEIFGLENLEAIGCESSFVMIGSHLANWELTPASMNHRLNSPAACIVREPNNPYTARILSMCRNFGGKGAYLPKSTSGTRAMVKTLIDGGRIGILIDQKYNQGIPVEFFGRPAMTSTAPAQLALKFGVPIIPFQMIRLKGNRARMIIHPAMNIEGKDEAAIMLDANKMIEGWIRENPGQWLWLHRRWDSKVLQQETPK